MIMMDILNDFQFVQSENEPTHVKGHCLDWVMHRPDDHVVKSVTVTQALTSVHYCILCELSVRRPVDKPLYVTSRSVLLMDLSAFQSDFSVRWPPRLSQLTMLTLHCVPHLMFLWLQSGFVLLS